MSWTPDYPQQSPAKRQAAVFAAVRRPPRGWFAFRWLVWLLCVALSVFVIAGAGTHLGSGLRAAHGEGIPGLWTAQQYGGGQWNGEFVSSDGTVTLPNVEYAGSLSAVQPGTVVPALDAGAGGEVYPLTGSDKWIRDLIIFIVGWLALITLLALLARGFFVARRRRRAAPPDYLAQAVTPAGRVLGRRSRPGAPQTRAGKLTLLIPMVALMGWVCARFGVLLADVRPAAGWYWFVALAAGIVIAVAPPWALARATRAARAAGRPRRRWAGWLLIGYTAALAGGIKYYLSLRYIPPPSGATAAPPTPLFVLEMAGLAAETVVFVAITLLLLTAAAEIIAPGPVGGWVRARFKLGPIPALPDQGLANTPDRDA